LIFIFSFHFCLKSGAFSELKKLSRYLDKRWINAKSAAAGDLEPAKSPTVPSDGGKNGNGFTYF